MEENIAQAGNVLEQQDENLEAKKIKVSSSSDEDIGNSEPF